VIAESSERRAASSTSVGARAPVEGAAVGGVPLGDGTASAGEDIRGGPTCVGPDGGALAGVIGGGVIAADDISGGPTCVGPDGGALAGATGGGVIAGDDVSGGPTCVGPDGGALAGATGGGVIAGDDVSGGPTCPGAPGAPGAGVVDAPGADAAGRRGSGGNVPGGRGGKFTPVGGALRARRGGSGGNRRPHDAQTLCSSVFSALQNGQNRITTPPRHARARSAPRRRPGRTSPAVPTRHATHPPGR